MSKIYTTSSSTTAPIAPTGQSPALEQKQPLAKIQQAHAHNAPLTNLYVSPDLLMKEGYVTLRGTITKMDTEKLWLTFDEGTLILEKFMHGLHEEVGDQLYLYMLKEQFEDLRQSFATKTDKDLTKLMHQKFEAWKSLKDGNFLHKVHEFFPKIDDNLAPQLHALLMLARKAHDKDDLIKHLFDPRRAERLSEKQLAALLTALMPTHGKGFSTQFCPLYDGMHYHILEVHYLPKEKSAPNKKHFEFALKNTPFGIIILEGLYDGAHLFMKLKTENTLHSSLKDDLNALYQNVLTTYHLKGSLKYETHKNLHHETLNFTPLNIHL